jgi:type II secretory pathway pseudopilin PulG
MSRSSSSHRAAGFTMIEAIFTLTMIAILLVSIMSTTIGIQDAFFQSQVVSELNLRAQRVLDRVVALSGQALTSDTEFGGLKPNAGGDFHCLRFRMITAIDANTGAPIYDDALKVYVYGADTGVTPCSGIVIGRGPDLATVHANGAGADAVLGTEDDAVNTLSNGVPVVELLVPSNFAPQNGEMFTIGISGRVLTFTIRLNARDADDKFVMPNDLVLTERVALRQ